MTDEASNEMNDGKPVLLDTYCGGGGATKGYQRAGFFVVGIDIKPQPNYCGDAFIRGDVIGILGRMLKGEKFLASDGRWYRLTDFAAIHASPPCQRYSLGSARWDKEHPDLLNKTENLLQKIGLPAVIENVERAPFTWPTITLCGIQFYLDVIRHRKFATNWFCLAFPHNLKHPKRGEFVTCAGHGGNGSNKYSVWAEAMGIDWMTKPELTQAIPPTYTEYIGRQLLTVVNRGFYA